MSGATTAEIAAVLSRSRHLLDVIETGTLREKDQGHCWIWKAVEGRDDNLLCVAALLADAVIVKTVMHHFDPEGT